MVVVSALAMDSGMACVAKVRAVAFAVIAGGVVAVVVVRLVVVVAAAITAAGLLSLSFAAIISTSVPIPLVVCQRRAGVAASVIVVVIIVGNGEDNQEEEDEDEKDDDDNLIRLGVVAIVVVVVVVEIALPLALALPLILPAVVWTVLRVEDEGSLQRCDVLVEGAEVWGGAAIADTQGRFESDRICRVVVVCTILFMLFVCMSLLLRLTTGNLLHNKSERLRVPD